MKLYGTITSERATKGQGGNDYLNISIKDENEAVAWEIHIEKMKLKNWLMLELFSKPGETIRQYHEIKAKKQKGESYCKAQVAEQLCNNKAYKDDYCIKHYKMFNE